MTTVPELLEKGLDSGDIIGYHGTSLEAVLKLHETGRMPDGGRCLGEFYFATISDFDGGPADFTRRVYAPKNAVIHFIISRLPFVPTEEDVQALSEYCDCDVRGKLCQNNQFSKGHADGLHSVIQKCERAGLDDLTLNRFFQRAKRERKGIVLTIGNALARDFTVHTVRNDPEDSYVQVSGGLPIKYITGIEPCGQYEWDVLANLKK